MFSAEAIIFAEYLQKQQWSRLREAFNLRRKYDNPAVEKPSQLFTPFAANDSARSQQVERVGASQWAPGRERSKGRKQHCGLMPPPD